MANELRPTLNVAYAKGFQNFNINPSVTPITIAGDAYAFSQSIGTGEETVDFGDATAANYGYCWLHNLDPENFVTWGPDSTGMVAAGQIDPGGWAFFQLTPSVVIIAQADTAACLIEGYLIEI